MAPRRVFRVLDADSPAGERWLTRLVERGARVLDRRTERAAGAIVRAVRERGDAALLELVEKHDGVRVASAAELRLSSTADDSGLPAGFTAALETAIDAVERYHALQVHGGFEVERDGVWLQERRLPLQRVGLYVPGGRAVYPSTVVMTVVPARAAGVREIAVATPPQAYRDSAALRYTLRRLGVDEVWGMGGAHAIAAFAYGTPTVPRVDKILGPGNAWVTAAKAAVARTVAIDGVAGPSEVVIVAGAEESPEWVAADLLAQAEHDPRAAAVLITPSRALARRVGEEIERQLAAIATGDTARAALRAFGGALVVDTPARALGLVDTIAPEHLQLVGAWAEDLAPRVRNAGAIFLGALSPEVFGDYVAGPSHVLPTCGTARFASALGVEDFVRRSHVIRFDDGAARRGAVAAAALADAEGLPAHAAAARRRS